ncbi:Transcription activator AMTR1 like protein [Verticillium longisporum]|uniref:Transcription activator AMTR1 like protein n=1 Tax=Verticillium longisporum TaxID=100787 RepID=A0A8I3ART5_VERLO|nr:Transcription activator AMTR1 like protein [Verticillium longisporum]
MLFTAVVAILLALGPLAAHAKSQGIVTHPTSDTKLDLNSDDRSMKITWAYEGDSGKWDDVDLVLQGESRDDAGSTKEWSASVRMDIDMSARSFTYNSTRAPMASAEPPDTPENGYLEYQEELRCLIFNTAQTAAPTREGTPEPGTTLPEALPLVPSFPNPSDDAANRRQAAQTLASPRRLEFLKNYVAEVAPWLDMFDSDRAFGIQVPVLAQSSPALLYAVLALSARQMERKEGRQSSFDSLELYQEAIRLLTPLLQVRDQKIIPICTILCCMEMMSASAQDWRKHLEGCASLFDSFNVHGFTGGLLQAVFWCYARMDLCGALISDGTESTLLQPSKWLPSGATHSEAVDLFRQSTSPDMYANHAVYLCAKVCELVADRTRFYELGDDTSVNPDDLTDGWLRLWDDLQSWNLNRPPEMLPAQTIQSTPFPQILFLHWAAISSNQLYHTACVLLLGSMPRPLNLKLGISGSAVWHAKHICGISLTNPHQGCLNNAIQPLWVAGRLLSHKSEHALLVQLIRSIEAMTGWGTCWRIDDLESAWGYKVRGKSSRMTNVTV